MSDPSVRLQIQRFIVGELAFPSPHQLQARRSIDGIILTIPTRVEVYPAHEDLQGRPALVGVRAEILHDDVLIGVARDDEPYLGREGACDGELSIALASNVMHSVERSRNGGAVRFRLRVFCYVSTTVPSSTGRPLLSLPERSIDTVNVAYEREAWTEMLSRTGISENVVVEIPLPKNPGPPWDTVWDHLRSARLALETGGPGRWDNVVVQSRKALESWQKIEPEDHGDGWKAPTRSEREARSREQRRDNLRWHLLQCAHEAAHAPAGGWTREDAALMLSTLAGLLAVRSR